MDALYKTKEVARILNISQWTVREMLKSGKLQGFKIGTRDWRVSESALREYVRKQHG